MSTNELEKKLKELRQIMALIEEAQAEAETIKDEIKATMGDQEELRAGGIQGYMEACHFFPPGHSQTKKGAPRCGRSLHDHKHH